MQTLTGLTDHIDRPMEWHALKRTEMTEDGRYVYEIMPMDMDTWERYDVVLVPVDSYEELVRRGGIE